MRTTQLTTCASTVVNASIGITLRGRPGDRAKFHQSNALYLEPVIQAIDMPFVPIERAEDIPRIATAYRHSRVISRPVFTSIRSAAMPPHPASTVPS